jgi:hypothetical protein
MYGEMNKWRMGLALPVLCAALFLTALPSAANYAYDGFEVKNMVNGTVQGDVFASYGDHAGLASANPYETNYNVPSGTVKWARLYVGIWGGNKDNTGWVNTTLNASGTVHYLGNVTLNGASDSNPTYSGGTNAYSSGNGVWMVSYNATNNVTMGAFNNVSARTGGSIDGRIYGIALVVVYESTDMPEVQYWVNEGNVNLDYATQLNNNISWFNGTAYNSTEAKLTALYYTGTNGEHDYLYLNAPYASDSPYNLPNIGWNIPNYRRYQLDSNDVANSYSGLVSTSYFDLDSFTSSNDSTALKDIINTTAANSNYAIFWRGHDDNGNGIIDTSWNASGIEGEAYVHPILAVLKLKNITHVYDFSAGAGVNKWAYKGQVSSKPPTANDVPSNSIDAYSNIAADDGTYETYVTSTNNNYAAHRFNFSIAEASPTKFNVTWNGKGRHDNGGTYNGTYLYVWNGTSAAYEELANNSVGTDATLNGEVTSSINSYINAGNVTVLAVQKSAQSPLKKSRIETDYVKLVVTP